jgi:RNA polymerase sigma-70 factor (ECF subfamily)
VSQFRIQLEDALPDLWRYAFSLTRNRALADDLVQDCAERAIRKRLLWMPGRPLKPWLMKILLNLFRSHHARNKGRHFMPLDDTLADTGTRADDDSRLELAATLQGLEQLSDEQREALLLVVVGGLDYLQAAGALGIPVGTLMSRIARARAKLRKWRAGDDTPAIRSVP